MKERSSSYASDDCEGRSIRSEFERTKFVFCMSKYPGANFAREFRRKRNAKPISFSAKRNFGLRAKSVRSSKLYLLGEIVLKAKIAFQKVLGEIHFTQDLVWVKLARHNAHTKLSSPRNLYRKVGVEIARAAGRIHPNFGVNFRK